MSNYNTHTGKVNKLVAEIEKVNGQRPHRLYIASCYFATDAAAELIGQISNRVTLDGVEVYLDKRTAIKVGQQALVEFEATGENLKVFTVSHSPLFHSKGYALANLDEEGEVTSGSLVIGSANLTKAGLTSDSGNIESILSTQDPDEIQRFVDSLDEVVDWNDIESLEADLVEEDDSVFNFALLNEGEFIHKWDGSLDAFLSVKHNLSDKAIAEAQIDPELGRRGFSIVRETVSKQYFNFDMGPYQGRKHGKALKRFRSNYGIECRLGHWVPKGTLESVVGTRNYHRFRGDFEQYVQNNLDRIQSLVKQETNALLRADLIKPPKTLPHEALERKVKRLLSDDGNLRKWFFRLEPFDLPYDQQEVEKIDELADEITEVANRKGKKNAGVRAWLAGLNERSVVALRSVVEQASSGADQED